MDPSKKFESVRNQYIAACIINIMGFCHGCGLGWISPTLPTLMVPTAPLDQPLTTSQAALVSSILCVGAMPAAPFYGWLADHYGRKTSIVAAAFPYLACWLMKLLWRSALGLMTARFLAGVGASGLFMLCPLYASEVGTLGTRGVLGTLAAFSMNAGVVFMYVLATYASYSMVLMVMIPVPIVFLLLMTMMPETPAFLVKNNRINEAAKALAWLRRVPLDSGVVLDEINNLKKDIEISSKKTEDSKLSQIGCSSMAENNARNHDGISKWKLFIYSVPTRSAFLVCFSLLSIQACMGVYAVITFSTDIFTAAAGSAVSPSLSCIIVGLLQLIGSVLASFLIERLGRKILIICSSLAVSSAMGGMALYFSLRERAYDVSALGWAPVLALSVAVCAFSMGAGPVPYVLPSELFNVQARGLATSMLMTWAWFASFVIAQVFSSSVVFFGIDVVFWFFSAMGLALISVSVFFLPETKGKTIAEVQLYYKKDKTQPRSRKQSEIGELL